MENQNIVFIAAYGSLRKNEYNFLRFNNNEKTLIEYIETQTINGFNLYSLGPYPGIKEGDGKLVVDILKINDNNIASTIHRMEIGAGYEKKVINIRLNSNTDINANIYIYKGITNEKMLIKSGDWSQYLQEIKRN